jgi:hypothetical protein
MGSRPMLIIAGALSVLMVTAVSAWGGNPPGNNGTVKVGTLLDDTKGNQPHVDCEFLVEFAGFDAGPLYGSATVEWQAPSGNGGVLFYGSTFIGYDPAGGANDSDATITVNLFDPIAASGVAAQSQGFHVKLTTHADGSIGADTKHKTFWVSGCGGGEGEGEGGGEGGGE